MAERFTIISWDITTGHIDVLGIFDNALEAMTICRMKAKREADEGVDGKLVNIDDGAHLLDKKGKITWVWAVYEIGKITY